MGASLSACFRPPSLHVQPPSPIGQEWSSLDETLGHSFCYLPSSNRFLLHSPSDSLRFDGPAPASSVPPVFTDSTETALFKSISGASVGANASLPPSVAALRLHSLPDYAEDHSVPTAPVSGFCSGGGLARGNAFESTSSFRAVELQPVPRGEDGFFLSGPIERGAMSGPLVDGWPDGVAGPHIHFSAPVGGAGGDHGGMPDRKKRRRKKRGGISGIRNSLAGGFAENKWVVPVRSFNGSKEAKDREIVRSINFVESYSFAGGGLEEENVEWASGKAGEDRAQVVVSEEQGWLFVGIYDGFNGPDAPEFLMDRLYRAVYIELQGLFWEDVSECSNDRSDGSNDVGSKGNPVEETVAMAGEASLRTDDGVEAVKIDAAEDGFGEPMERSVKFESGVSEVTLHRRRLWEFLADEDAEDGLDLSGSQRFAFSVDDAINVSNVEGSGVTRRRLLLSKLKHGLKDGHAKRLFPWRFGLKEKVDEAANNIMEEKDGKRRRRRKEGPVDHELVLRAMSRALEATEAAYLEMSGKVIDTHPELALMGSCLLVALMRDEDIYIMNVGDSRAIVAQLEERVVSSLSRDNCKEATIEGIAEERGSRGSSGRYKKWESEVSTHAMRLVPLQLSTDHSTSIEEEVTRIKNEHPDDGQCIVNGRVKGRLKVTRAFGAGFLKQPKLNAAVLEMFRNEYIGTAPYLSCTPALRHHKLCPRDQFLMLSSDGLYQYLTNEEVVAHVESFMEKFPEGDPAQHLIEEVLSRAAKKAGMGFRELLDVPQGDRRKYHDDVMVMVISLEGRIWKSSGKYI